MEQQSEAWQIRETYSTDADSRVRLGRYTVPQRVVAHRYGNPDDPDGRRAPTLAFTFEIRDGAAVCTDVRAIAAPGDRGIRQSDLALNLDALAESAFRWAADDVSEPFAWYGDKPGARGEVNAAVDAGHSATPPSELRHVARIYLDPKHRRRPAWHVEELLGYPHTTAFRKIGAARSAGLIPPKGAAIDELDAAFAALMEGESDEQAR